MARGFFGDIARATGTAPLFGVKSSAELAANRQLAAAEQAKQPLEQGYTRLSELYQPYATAAQEQLGGLAGLSQQIAGQEYGVPQYQAPKEFTYSQEDFAKSPYYQMQQRAGEQAINRQMAARGLFASTPALQNITKYNQELAAGGYQQARQNALQEAQANRSAYENYINMLRQLGQERYGRASDQYTRSLQQIQTGTPFTQALGSAATQRASDLASLLTQRGNIQAATEIQNANEMRNTLGQLAKMGATLYTGGVPGLAASQAFQAPSSTPAGIDYNQLAQALIQAGGKL